MFGLESFQETPLVLLVGLLYMIGINSKFSFVGVGGALFERNLIRH
jgi:hypothetical protein